MTAIRRPILLANCIHHTTPRTRRIRPRSAWHLLYAIPLAAVCLAGVAVGGWWRAFTERARAVERSDRW